MKSDGETRTVRARARRSRRAAGDGERVFQGLAVSPGIAIGPAHVHESGRVTVVEQAIPADAIEAEQQRFNAAVEKSLHQLAKLKAKSGALPDAVGEDLGYLLDAHRQMLSSSRLVRGVERRIADDKINAEAAVQAEIGAIVQGFTAMDDAYLASRGDDVREVGDRLLRNLTQRAYQAFKNLPDGSIVVAEEVTPADTALMDPEHVGGFATVLGGAEGHTAIMAR